MVAAFGTAVTVENGVMNLLSPDQSSVGTDLTGFIELRATISRSAEWAWCGGHSLKVVTPGTAEFEGFQTSSRSVIPSRTYCASAYVLVPAGARMTFALAEWTAAAYVGETVFSFIGTGIPQRVSVTRTFGATGARARLQLTTEHSFIQALTVYADGMMIHEGAYPLSWHIGGKIWTLRTSAADNEWWSVCWSPERGLFVAVAADGTGNRVMTSPDGIDWTIRTSAADNSWRSVCWSPERGLFVAVAGTGTGNRVMTSPDSVTLDAFRLSETLTIPTAGVLLPTAGTVEQRIYLLRAPDVNEQFIFDGAGPVNQNLQVLVATNGKLTLRYGTGAATVEIQGALYMARGTWYAIAWRWSSAGVALLVNGAVVASSATAPSIEFGANAFFGSRADNTLHLDGLIDDLRISNRARTDAEILAGFNSNAPLPLD